jgi:hypothetical protein
MATIPQFNPPGGLDDFDSIPHQREAWNEFLFNTFQANVHGIEQSVGSGNSQFYNPQVNDTVSPNVQKRSAGVAFRCSSLKNTLETRELPGRKLSNCF